MAMNSNVLKKLAELEAQATPGPWETVNHETYCGGMGCTPDGCPGHDTGVAYNIDGPMLLRDGEYFADSFNPGVPQAEQAARIAEEERKAYRQADVDSKFISLFRQHAKEIFQALAIYEMTAKELAIPGSVFATFKAKEDAQDQQAHRRPSPL
jgi:hypothetical protein